MTPGRSEMGGQQRNLEKERKRPGTSLLDIGQRPHRRFFGVRLTGSEPV